MSDKKRADELIQEAQSKKSGGFFKKIFGTHDDADDIIDLYKKAASHYKIAKEWEEAGKTYLIAAKMSESDSKDLLTAASIYADAGKVLQQVCPREAIDAYTKTINIYMDMDKHGIVARYVEACAEIYEKELKEFDKCAEFYERAADLYRSEDRKAAANKLLLKVAEYSALNQNYKKSMKIYETYALESLKTPLIKFGAKEYFFRACLVALCYDILEAQVYLDKFNEADPSFQNSREGELIKEILRSVDDADVNIFVDAVKKYDSISRLDPWFVQLLNRIKKPLEEFVDLT